MAKHIDETPNELKQVTAESLLHPLQLKKMLQNCAEKFARDDCYPKTIQDEFKTFTPDINDVLHTFALIKEIIICFNGNQEKFLPQFYRTVHEETHFFKDLSRNCCLLLGFEVANHIFAHLSGAKQNKEAESVSMIKKKFSGKERNVITYLSGHVFSEMYKRVRRSKSWECSINQNYLSLLEARKSSDQIIQSNKDYCLTAAKNRGGLWLVNPIIVDMFLAAEAVFRIKTEVIKPKIDQHDIVKCLLKESSVHAAISHLRNNATLATSNEITKNLVEELLSLFVRIRVFSYAKDICQSQKAAKGKERSLRKETS
eukprot:gene6574-12110_t